MPKPHFQTTNNKVAEIIRVNHAGEYGAKVIYEGQLRFCKNKKDHALIVDMLRQEKEHLNYFSHELVKRQIRPTVMMPLWRIGGYLLGAMSSIAGSKTAMLITESVEDVIIDHYQEQLHYLQKIDSEQDLFNHIKQFKEDESEHKAIAIESDAPKAFGASVIHKVVKNLCRGAIYLSKRI